MTDYPRVGVAAIITHNGRILLIRRKNVHGSGCWSTPGGHLDFGETPEQCAIREVQEEVGVEISNVRLVAFTNDFFETEGKHYLSLWMEGTLVSGEPKIAADYEVAEFGWFEWDSLPSPLFIPFDNLVKQKSYPPEGLNNLIHRKQE